MIASWVVVAGALAAFCLGFRLHRALLTPPSTRPEMAWPGIRAFQVPGDGTAMERSMERLGEVGRARLRKALWLDALVMVPAYVALLVTLCWISQRVVEDVSAGRLEAVGTAIAYGAAAATLLAGLLDLVENIAVGVAHGRWEDLPGRTDEFTETCAAERWAKRRELARRMGSSAWCAKNATRSKVVLIALAAVWLFISAIIAVTHAIH